MVWESGQKLHGGRYTIQKKLGEGGFGITFLAQNNKGQLVVIKTLRDNILSRPKDAKSRNKLLYEFKEEALRLAVCRHPHIVEIENVFHEDSLPCIAMEYVPGMNLWEWVEDNGSLQEEEAVSYIQQIGNALNLIHEKGLLHRDVKPNNIIKRQSCEEAVLIDFGIAREFTHDVTLTHTAVLTPGFAPLEQYDHQARRGEYTDVYGLSATLYFLLTGEVPPPAYNRIVKDYLIPPDQIVSVSLKVNKAILAGLELHPQDRPQSMPEWLAMFFEIAPERYQKLEQFLEEGEWKKADLETTKIMLQIANRTEEGYLDQDSINNLSCHDLSKIDRLWLKYSNRRFGFSIQKKMWLDLGGKSNYEVECKLGEQIGWRKGAVLAEWINYRDLNFSLEAPVGHLPSFPPCFTHGIVLPARLRVRSSFFVYLDFCKL